MEIIIKKSQIILTTFILSLVLSSCEKNNQSPPKQFAILNPVVQLSVKEGNLNLPPFHSSEIDKSYSISFEGNFENNSGSLIEVSSCYADVHVEYENEKFDFNNIGCNRLVFPGSDDEQFRSWENSQVLSSKLLCNIPIFKGNQGILLHKAKNVTLDIRIVAKNSVGYLFGPFDDSKGCAVNEKLGSPDDNKIISVNITESWNSSFVK